MMQIRRVTAWRPSSEKVASKVHHVSLAPKNTCHEIKNKLCSSSSSSSESRALLTFPLLFRCLRGMLINYSKTSDCNSINDITATSALLFSHPPFPLYLFACCCCLPKQQHRP
ncbi:hypothetical protein E2C01_088406 [Portunus trituberculatus]|uniref:Uncharacterized protein n=1 Tax=Portunus trituberculatus TaxID=210409 RepID=A0A5B7JAN9_PORTR|nr:hypothetical protein [Portunus trituberculatus]